MRKILQPFRLLAMAINILSFIVLMTCIWFVVRERWKRVRLSNRILSYFCRNALWNLGIKVKAIGLENVHSVRNALLVGNHLSYLDVLMISAYVPACFVTSVEVRDTPGLGLICRRAGCLFVERRNKMNIHSEVQEVREGLEHGLNVAIFPESTSTNGEAMLRFRRPLYVAALDAEVPVVPFCLNYQSVGGKPLSLETRDLVFWYGDMDFVPHLWKLCGQGGAVAHIHFLPPVKVVKTDDAKVIAEQTQIMVEKTFVAVK